MPVPVAAVSDDVIAALAADDAPLAIGAGIAVAAFGLQHTCRPADLIGEAWWKMETLDDAGGVGLPLLPFASLPEGAGHAMRAELVLWNVHSEPTLPTVAK